MPIKCQIKLVNVIYFSTGFKFDKFAVFRVFFLASAVLHGVTLMQ